MKTEQRTQALQIISESQEVTAAVTVQIGGSRNGNMVENDTLYIIDCPAHTIKKLQQAGFSVCMNNGKLQIEKY